MSVVTGRQCPWTAGSRLVSLWDIMEQFNAENFHTLGWILGFIEGFGHYDQPDADLEKGTAEEILRQLIDAKEECEPVGLRVCVIHIDEIIDKLTSSLKSNKPLKRKQIAVLSEQLFYNVRREMGVTKFFRLSGDTQRYFNLPNAFGEVVAGSFPKAEYDILESGNCLALSRSTACVFHAMRILEYGLCALADKFGVPFEHKSWNDVIEPIEKAIRQIKNQSDKPTDWKDEEQFYSEAASQFMHFKNAWRNYTAHRQFKYTETEAESIFRHVRDFMTHIAKRLKETQTSSDADVDS